MILDKPAIIKYDKKSQSNPNLNLKKKKKKGKFVRPFFLV
jgi:hypothetical protein